MPAEKKEQPRSKKEIEERKIDPGIKSQERIDQQQDRYRAQQKARLETPLRESFIDKTPSSEVTQPESAETTAGRGPAKIANRLQADRVRKADKKSQAATGSSKAFASGNIDMAAIKRIRNIWRVVNISSGVTLVGLIVPFFSMNGFLILGNLFKFKRVPSLSIIEIIIIIIFDFILLVFLLILLVFMYFLVHPCEAVKAGLEGWEIIADILGFACGLIGKIIGVVK